jgi:chromosome segregation ATPase
LPRSSDLLFFDTYLLLASLQDVMRARSKVFRRATHEFGHLMKSHRDLIAKHQQLEQELATQKLAFNYEKDKAIRLQRELSNAQIPKGTLESRLSAAEETHTQLLEEVEARANTAELRLSTLETRYNS